MLSTGVERSYCTQSFKNFFMVDRPFWKDRDAVTGEHLMFRTRSDRLNHANYLLDNEKDKYHPSYCPAPRLMMR